MEYCCTKPVPVQIKANSCHRYTAHVDPGEGELQGQQAGGAERQGRVPLEGVNKQRVVILHLCSKSCGEFWTGKDPSSWRVGRLTGTTRGFKENRHI